MPLILFSQTIITDNMKFTYITSTSFTKLRFCTPVAYNSLLKRWSSSLHAVFQLVVVRKIACILQRVKMMAVEGAKVGL
jgi:hypothetical protein